MLEPLRHFTLVATHRTFTAAARHAFITQSALTASIQRLEAQMGAKLFVRGPSGASLTAAGEALLPRARAALAALEEGKRAVAEVMGLATGEVRIGAGATVCTYYLPRLLAQYRKRFPGVKLHLRESNPDALLDALEAGELDLLVLARMGRGPRGFTEGTGPLTSGVVAEKWLHDELVLVASPEIDAATAPFVTFAKGATTRTLVDRHFPGTPVAMELGSIAAIKGHVRAGVGIALVSRIAVERELEAGAFVLVPHDRVPIPRPLHLVHRGSDRLPPAASELAKLLRKQTR